jgi:hypothetical protein
MRLHRNVLKILVRHTSLRLALRLNSELLSRSVLEIELYWAAIWVLEIPPLYRLNHELAFSHSSLRLAKVG